MIAPRICAFPDVRSSLGREAVNLCGQSGLILDDWQAYVLERSLGVRDDGMWAARDVGLMVSRQNGKGAVLAGRMLAGLLLVEEQLITYSAHLFDTSMETLDRVESIFLDDPSLRKRVARVVRSHGLEAIRLKNGQRIRFRTRTKGGGRGFSGECLLIDEAQFLSELAIRALGPTMAAQRNPQAWFAGTPVDELSNVDGDAFARIRRRGIAGDAGVAYFEWSADVRNLDGDAGGIGDVTWEMARDMGVVEGANPALGIRITEEYVRNELQQLGLQGFAQERLGVGNWPTGLLDAAEAVLDLAVWDQLEQPGSVPADPVCFAFDVTPRRTSASIAAAGLNQDGVPHGEVIDRRPGTGWVAERLAELVKRHRNSGVVYGRDSPAESLTPDLDALGVAARGLTLAENAAGCGRLFDAVETRTVRHLGNASPNGQALREAIVGAVKREVGDKWVWSRRESRVDIAPLIAFTLSLYELSLHQRPAGRPMVAWA